MNNREIVFVYRESSEGGYEAKALGYSIFTQGDTTCELKLAVLDAVNCHFDRSDRPEIIRFLSDKSDNNMMNHLV